MRYSVELRNFSILEQFSNNLDGWGFVPAGKYVNKLRPGDVFRDWLVDVMDESISNRDCEVNVFRFDPSSHTVCRYELNGEGFSVMGKFFAEPTGKIREYDPCIAMMAEYKKLKKADAAINIAKPIAVNKDFNCVLLTEFIPGRSLSWYLGNEDDLYGKLTSIAHLLHRLHKNTRTWYDKENEFSRFHNALDLINIGDHAKNHYKRLIGKWWYSSRLDWEYGCMIHHDATPSNYIFHNGDPYAIDFELSASHGNPVHDLGIMCAELKHFFAINGSDQEAEPYIGHFLWQYSRCEEEFHKITRTLPFYMGYGLLRIARLEWNLEYRKYLLREAESCLKAVDRKGF